MSEIRAGDVIVWRTWSGEALAQIVWVGRDGSCGIKSLDGYESFHDRVPVAARLALPQQRESFLSRVRTSPVAYE